MAAKLSKKELKGPDIFQSSFEKITDYIYENTIRFLCYCDDSNFNCRYRVRYLSLLE